MALSTLYFVAEIDLNEIWYISGEVISKIPSLPCYLIKHSSLTDTTMLNKLIESQIPWDYILVKEADHKQVNKY